jgi:hypothetical protein
MGSRACRAGSFGCLVLFVYVSAAAAAEAVDIELVLAVDRSISVDGPELDLQRQGLAAAFRDPAVIEAIRLNSQGVAVSVMLWAGVDQHETVVDWSRLTDAGTAARFADAIDAALRLGPTFGGKTALGDALWFALRSLAGNRYDGALRKVDVSGDGRANEGLRPEPVRDAAVLSGVTINGLAIINDDQNLEEYYRTHVIGGPGAFVMVAADYADFVEAIRRKLLRELTPAPIAGGPGTIAPPGSTWTSLSRRLSPARHAGLSPNVQNPRSFDGLELIRDPQSRETAQPSHL